MKAKLIFTSFLFAALACSKDDGVLSDRPPFDEFWLSTRFNYTVGASTYSNLKYYNVWGKMKDEPITGGTYWYYLSNTSAQFPSGNGELPAGGSLKITSKEGNIIIIEGLGVLPRQGERLPNSFVGDGDLWNSTKCNYKIVIEVNTTTEQVTKAWYEITNGKFYTSQDITKAMEFGVSTVADIWNISSKKEMIIGNADIRFTLDLL